eukprot:465168_1
MSPTESPTPAPSHSPITYDPPFSNLKTVYIRSFGCDYGTCESQYANYTSFCQQHNFRKYSMDAFTQCCDPSITLSPTITMFPSNNPSIETYTPTISPTPYPTFFTKKTDEGCEEEWSNDGLYFFRCSYRYNIDVFPSFTQYTNFEVSVKGNHTWVSDKYTWRHTADHPTEWIYKVIFTINNVSCFNPSISFDFKRLNNVHEDEIIEIYGLNVDKICGGDDKP